MAAKRHGKLKTVKSIRQKKDYFQKVKVCVYILYVEKKCRIYNTVLENICLSIATVEVIVG